MADIISLDEHRKNAKSAKTTTEYTCYQLDTSKEVNEAIQIFEGSDGMKRVAIMIPEACVKRGIGVLILPVGTAIEFAGSMLHATSEIMANDNK